MQRKVSILGSCVARDVFTLLDNNLFKLQTYIARQPLGNAFSKPIDLSAWTSKLEKKFFRRALDDSFSGNFGDRIIDSDFDLLIVDFIDERLALYDVDGIYIALSQELMDVGYPSAPVPSAKVVVSGTKKHFDLWQAGMEKFASILENEKKNTQIMLLRINWAYLNENGGDWDPKIINKGNRYLDLLYESFVTMVPRTQCIEPPKELCVRASKHRWGEAPFHFIDEYYLHIAQQITTLAHGNMSPPMSTEQTAFKFQEWLTRNPIT